MQREKKEIQQLYQSIKALSNHGKLLSNLCDHDEKAVLTIKLSDELLAKANEFFNVQVLNKTAFPAFQQQMLALLQKDEYTVSMAAHRNMWKIYLVNIAIALTILGVFMLAAKSLYMGKFSLFCDKTKRQTLVEDTIQALSIATSDEQIRCH